MISLPPDIWRKYPVALPEILSVLFLQIIHSASNDNPSGILCFQNILYSDHGSHCLYPMTLRQTQDNSVHVRHHPVSLPVSPHSADASPVHNILKNMPSSFRILQFSSCRLPDAESVVRLRLLHVSVCLHTYAVFPDRREAT